MWTRFKGQVLRGKEEKDNDSEDTIVTRALLKYYEPEVPNWLLPPGSELREKITSQTLADARYTAGYSYSAPLASQQHRSPQQPSPQPFIRRESAPRLFDRHDQPVTNQSPPQPRSNAQKSGLANSLRGWGGA